MADVYGQLLQRIVGFSHVWLRPKRNMMHHRQHAANVAHELNQTCLLIARESLQSSARSWRTRRPSFLGALSVLHWISHLETSSVLMAGVAEGGFHGHGLWHFAVMWAILAFLFGPSCHGRASRMEQLRFHVNGMEEGSRISVAFLRSPEIVNHKGHEGTRRKTI